MEDRRLGRVTLDLVAVPEPLVVKRRKILTVEAERRDAQ